MSPAQEREDRAERELNMEKSNARVAKTATHGLKFFKSRGENGGENSLGRSTWCLFFW